MGYGRNSCCGNNKAVLTELKTSYTFEVYNTEGAYCGQSSLGTLLDFVEDNFRAPEFTEQSIVPQDGATIEVNDNSENTYLVINASGTNATNIIKLPLVDNVADGQEIKVTTKEEITALTWNLNGVANSLGLPSTLAAAKSFFIRYSKDNDRWSAFI